MEEKKEEIKEVTDYRIQVCWCAVELHQGPSTSINDVQLLIVAALSVLSTWVQSYTEIASTRVQPKVSAVQTDLICTTTSTYKNKFIA
jgi:hypothetical protein